VTGIAIVEVKLVIAATDAAYTRHPEFELGREEVQQQGNPSLYLSLRVVLHLATLAQRQS